MDMTDLKRTEEALRASEERFKIIATNTPDHLLVQDADLRYTMVVNPQLGLTEKDMLGRTDFDILTREDAEAITAIKKRVMDTGNPERLTVPLLSRSGETNYFEGTYVPKRDGGGRIDGILGYFRNVTERNRAEHGLQKLNRTLMAFSKSSLETSGRQRGRAADEKAMQYIEKVHLTRFADAYPHTLSGGMKQRVAIARGMAMEPDILLMDEPFAALDALTRRRMQDELLGLWEETRFTVLFVTHSIPEAVKIGNRILLMTPHPGQVKAELNSLGPSAHPADVAMLEQRINDMLFADRVEQEEHV